MNQLDYTQAAAFSPTASHAAHNQALPAAYQQQQIFAQQQLQAQHNQQSQQHQRFTAPDGMYNASAAQALGTFTSAPFSQSIPTPTSAAAQQQQAALRQSASPHQPNSPFNAGTPQPQQQQVRYPMAAPPLPHTPVNNKQMSASPTPQSPNSSTLEQNRIHLLFEMNEEMMQEVVRLQAQGKGGATNPQLQVQMKAQNMDDRMATDEYIQILRRIQSNLSVLSQKAGMAPANHKTVPGPAHMTPPPSMPQLQSKYDRLRELYPNWPGMEVMAQQNAARAAAGVAANTNGTNA